jgi:hypothetical protein
VARVAQRDDPLRGGPDVDRHEIDVRLSRAMVDATQEQQERIRAAVDARPRVVGEQGLGKHWVQAAALEQPCGGLRAVALEMDPQHAIAALPCLDPGPVEVVAAATTIEPAGEPQSGRGTAAQRGRCHPGGPQAAHWAEA